MSDRNKSFRGHCNIDVSLDLETNSVLVELSYKPEILQQPLCRTMYKYHYKDVVEELKRQGLSVDRATVGADQGINNFTFGSRNERLTASYVFPLKVAKPKPERKAETVVQPKEQAKTKPIETPVEQAQPIETPVEQAQPKPSKKAPRKRRSRKTKANK